MKGIKRIAKKPQIRWTAMLKIEDICPRRSRWGDPYVLLYTNADVPICAEERVGNQVCLYEPYELQGWLKPYNGGTYLKLEKFELFNSQNYLDK